MAHRVHPKVFRIKNLTDWNSRWFNKKKLPQNLEEDFRIREFLKKRLKEAGVEKIEIERFPGKIHIIINTARPGLVIGRGGTGAEELKKDLEKLIVSSRPFSLAPLQPREKKEIKIDVREIRDPWTKANLVAQWIAQQLEKRTPYRRTLKQALDKIMASKEVKGARVEVAGRLDGIEIARTEWLKRGLLPRQTLRADIDYGTAKAYCTYGVVGVKVWIYKGEKF